MAQFFNLNEDDLNCAELFVAKYEFKEGKQAKLDAHVDGTPYSFVVALNDPSSQFTGGGTRFTESDCTYRPDKVGTAVIFSGKNEHEGVAVTSGVRYILTGFCAYDNTDKGHATFLAGYDRQYDGSAASARLRMGPLEDSGGGKGEREIEEDEERGGVHTGDILRGIRVFNRKSDDNDSGSSNVSGDVASASDDADGGTLMLLEGLSTSQVHQIVADCGRRLDGRECTILIERLRDDDDRGGPDSESDLQDEQRHVRKIAGSLLNKGKFWSFDYFLKEGFKSN
jgi:hypothetical protein